MIKLGGFALLVCLFFVSTDKPKKVVFFGDSITQAGASEGGYIRMMESSLAQKGMEQKAELIGEGIGGNKVYDLYLRMQDDVIAHNPDIVFIYIGVNDVWHKESFGTGTDPDKFALFYQSIIDTLKSLDIELILVTPGVIGEKTDHSNKLDGDMNEYAKIVKGLAVKNGAELIDLRGAMIEYNMEHNTDNSDRGILTNDRVHLNEVGNKFVADTFMKVLLKKIGS